MAGAFEEIGIGLVGDAGIRIGDLPNWLLCTRSIRWGAGGRVVPETAVLKNLADDIALAGFDVPDPT